MSSNRLVVVLGLGINGLNSAYFAAKRGWEVFCVDRNPAFTAQPIEQTSNAAIGIIEPTSKKGVCPGCYQDTRAFYARLLEKGAWWISKLPITYFTDESGFLDGPNGREADEQYREISKPKNGFRHGETFQNFVVNTNYHNHWMKLRLQAMGVRFIESEITCAPQEVRVDARQPDLIIDCRGMGLRSLEVGRDLIPVSGQTVVWHAPKGMKFARVLGNPGSTISFNVVDWAPVNRQMVRVLGLEGKLDPKEGGRLILGGATKHADDFNWSVQPYLTGPLVEGCARLDARVKDLRIVAVRKGLRPTMSEGILYNERVYGDTVLITFSGWGGLSYCASYGYIRQAIRRQAFAFKHGMFGTPALA